MGRTDPRELMNQDELHVLPGAIIGAIEPVSRVITRICHVLVPAVPVVDGGRKAGAVVAGRQVHHGLQHLRSHALRYRIEVGDVGGWCGDRFGGIGKVTARRQVPPVVHGRVEHIPLQPGRGVHHPVGPVLPPQFAHEISIRVDTSHNTAVVAPETHGYEFGHIQPETIDPRAQVAIAHGI